MSSFAITDGVEDPGHPAVGYLTVEGYKGGSTATLVGSRTVVSAAHAVLPGANHVFHLGSGDYVVSAVHPHPSWDGATNENDISVIVLAKPATETPAVLARNAPAVGQPILLVGFGVTGADATDSGGIKRSATNRIAKVEETRFSIEGSGGGVGNTCIGDSGGPAFIAWKDRDHVLAGVTSYGALPCGTLGFDTRVDRYVDWIAKVAGDDLYTGSAPARDADVDVHVDVDVDRAAEAPSATPGGCSYSDPRTPGSCGTWALAMGALVLLWVRRQRGS